MKKTDDQIEKKLIRVQKTVESGEAAINEGTDGLIQTLLAETKY